MKRKEKNKTSTPPPSINPKPEPTPLEIAVLKENFEMEEKIAKKWGRLRSAIILQMNALSS